MVYDSTTTQFCLWGMKAAVRKVKSKSVSHSVVSDFAHQAPLSFTVSQSLLKVMAIESMMLSNHLILCHSLLIFPSIFPVSQLFTSGGQSIGALASESVFPMNIQ